LRVRIKLVLIAAISIVVMVPVFMISSTTPQYEIKHVDVGKVLCAYNTGDERGALVVAYNKGKMNVYGDKLLGDLIESFEIPGILIDWGAWIFNEDEHILSVLSSNNHINVLMVFKVNVIKKSISIVKTTPVKDSRIISLFFENETPYFILYEEIDKDIDVYNLKGVKTDTINNNLVAFQTSEYRENKVYIYNHASITEYALKAGHFYNIKSISTFEPNDSLDYPVFPKDSVYEMPLYDRNGILIFDSDMNVYAFRKIDSLDKKITTLQLYNNKYGITFVSTKIEDINENTKYFRMNTCDMPGYNISFVPTNWDWLCATEYRNKRSNGLLVFEGFDENYNFKYLAYSGLPKGIEYVIFDFDDENNDIAYIYFNNYVYIASNYRFDRQIDTIRTISVGLPTTASIYIDWGQILSFFVFIVLLILATGFANGILRMF
jgi:hypothetical protein